jgi:hypothetical protein
MPKPPVKVIASNRFAESIGKKFKVVGDPKVLFTRHEDIKNVMTLTLTINFEVDPAKINTNGAPIAITEDMGDLFVADIGKKQTISTPDEIHFSYDNENTRINISAYAPPVDKGNHG